MYNEELIDLILFLKDQEYRIEEDDITVWLDFYDIKEFTELFGYDFFCEGGTQVTLLEDNIAFDLSDFITDNDDLELVIKKLKQLEN